MSPLESARASLAYVIADAGAALRNEIDMLISGGGSDRNVAKYTAEIRYCQEIGGLLDGYVAGSKMAHTNEASRTRNYVDAANLARDINVIGLTRMRMDRDERIAASRAA